MKETVEFLQLFWGGIFIQTFPDAKAMKNNKNYLTCSLNLKEYTKDTHAYLTDLNKNGAGIYFCANQLKEGSVGRSNENVEYVRAFFLDLDGAPLQPVIEAQLKPNVVVQTSADRYHCYWVLNEKVKANREQFREGQKLLAEKFNGDKSINDLARVMRLPGFNNMKSEPFMVRRVL